MSSAMPASGRSPLLRSMWPSSRRPAGPTQAQWSVEFVRTLTSGVSA